MTTIGYYLLQIVHFIFIVAGALFIGLHGYQMLTAKAKSMDNSPFKTARIQRGDLETTVSSTGSINAVGTVEVGTQVSGTIKHVYVDYNDRVKKGQILAALETDLLEASVSEAEAGVIVADAEYLQAEEDYKRNKKLYSRGHVTEQDLLGYQTEMEKSRAAKLSSQAALTRAKINLKNAQIRSPINGTVIERSVSAGQTVAANLSSPTLFILAEDLSLMQIEVNVDESDIGQIKEKQKVRFTVQTWPDDLFQGTVDMIRLNPETISNVVNYTVVVTTKNKKNLLLPGMTATVDFIIQERKDVLLIDNAAIKFGLGKDTTHNQGRVDSGESRFITMDNMGQLQPVVVETGLTDGAVTEIVGEDPLIVKEGTLVVIGVNRPQSTPSAKQTLMPRPPRGGGMGRLF